MVKGLIVSCQAVEGEVLHPFDIMGQLALAAKAGGAKAIRASGIRDIISIKKIVDLPIIGLIKAHYGECNVFITPTLKEVKELCEVGVEYIAIDATFRERPEGANLKDMISYVKNNYPDIKLVADIATMEEGVNAEKLGFNCISTTLCGYTENTKGLKIPNIPLIDALVYECKCKIIVEGGIWEVSQLKEIIEHGIDTVVIGTAVTRPMEITKRFNDCFNEDNAKIAAIDKNMTAESNNILFDWYNPYEKPFILTGFAYYDKDRIYRRLPLSTYDLFQRVNQNLNFLCTNTAGGQIHFSTDSNKVFVRVKLSFAHDMVNMPATAQCGFDCYVKYENEDKFHFIGVTRYNRRLQEYEAELVNNLNDGNKEIIINFPLYCGVESVSVGLEKGAKVFKPQPFSYNPMVFYGTSITQGGCVSRPGTAFTNILSRKFNCEVINFGFSANGLGEYEMAELIRDLPKLSLIALDYEANAGSTGRLEKSLVHFIEIIREHHKDIPILVISRIPYINDFYKSDIGKLRDRLRTFQSNTVDRFNNNGDKKIFFLNGYTFFDDNWEEYTVDIIHPTDIGHIKMAEKIGDKIREIFSSLMI